MSTRDLINAIASGDSIATQNAFESEIMSRIAVSMDEKRQEVARNLFKEATAAKVHPDAIHVKPAGKGKYQVHAVGSNMSDHVKVGEHLSDTELDDAAESGAKIKHVK